MGKRGWKKRVESLKSQIQTHENKINEERIKPYPDEGCIKHWEQEIEAFKQSLIRALKRLNR